MRIISNLLLWFVFISSFGQSPTTKSIERQFKFWLDSLQKANGFPGVTFSAILPNGESINVASGFADSSTGSLMKPGILIKVGGQYLWAEVQFYILLTIKNFNLTYLLILYYM